LEGEWVPAGVYTYHAIFDGSPGVVTTILGLRLRPVMLTDEEIFRELRRMMDDPRPDE